MSVSVSSSRTLNVGAGRLRLMKRQEKGGAYWATLTAIDHGLEFLGKSGKQAALYYIMMDGVSVEEAPSKPDEFAAALRHIFGTGASVVEDMIERKMKETRPRPALGHQSEGSVLYLSKPVAD